MARNASGSGDPLERYPGHRFRSVSWRSGSGAVALGSGSGRPTAHDAVSMFKILVMQTRLQAVGRPDRISVEGPAVVHAVCRTGIARPGAGCQDDLAVSRAVGACRRVGTTVRLVRRTVLQAKGWLAMGGQIIDATVIAARRLRLTQAEKTTIKG